MLVFITDRRKWLKYSEEASKVKYKSRKCLVPKSGNPFHMVQMLMSNICEIVGVKEEVISWYSNNSHGNRHPVSVAATL